MTGNGASDISRLASVHLCFAFVCVAICLAKSSAMAADAPEDQRQQQRAKLLERMSERARATRVAYPDSDREVKLLDSPVFRYDDQPRGFLDATMWLWTDQGRPVAFEKIEAMPNSWQFCFTSVSDKLLAVKWSDGREYHSTAAGVDFRPVVDAPAVPTASSARKLAARKLVRDFSARIFEVYVDGSEEMRVLPAPVYEYSDPQTKDFQGAVFSIAASGINPATLILLEARAADGELVWHYGVARMTSCGVTLRYRGNTVWQVDAHRAPPRDFPTWTFFYTAREQSDAADSDSKTPRPQAKPN